MPLRNMIYDALGYLKEYHEINERFKKKEGKKTSEEFLSGMGKEDRFHPIITIVIYYGDREWDGPYSLSNMMIEIPGGIKEIFSNYEMNLLQVKNSEEYSFANNDVETVFQISRKIYEKDFDWIFNNYKDKDIKAELGIIIGKITDSNFIINQSSDGKEVVNMCTALEELRQQGVEEGKKEGRIEGKIEGKIETARKSLKKGLPIDLIADITGLPIDEIEALIDTEGE